MQKIFGIYHKVDLDGYCSGAIIKMKYPEAELIGWNYGDDYPDIPDGSKVIMSDVSFPMDVMIAMGRKWELTWIDHHISVIRDFRKDPTWKPFLAVVDTEVAACELTWKHLFPDTPMPLAVRLLGEYDSWRDGDKCRWDTIVMPFQFGMRLITNSPESFPGVLLDASQDFTCQNIIENGDLILNYQKKQYESQCKKASFETTFMGLRCICLNGGGFNSGVFESVYDESKHDAMMPFQFNGEKWNVSLYSTKDEVDCSVVAKSMGGGGHKGAAGFMVDSLDEIIGG